MNPFNHQDMADYWIAMIRERVNPFREYVTDPALFAQLGGLPAGARVLDCGSGEGYLVRHLSERGHRAVGLDLSLAMLQAGKTAAVQKDQYICGNVFRLPFASGSFDAVVSNFLLIELARPDLAIVEICRLIRPGGKFIFQIVHPFSFTANSGQSEGRGVTDYFERQSFWEHFVIAKRESPRPSIRYHHPLHVYTEALSACGAAIISLEEPRPVTETPPDHPIWETLREPWFMLITAALP